MYPNGETRRVQNSVAYPSGETRRVQNSVAYPSGETWRVQNSVAYPSGETWRVQNSVAYPNGETWRVQNSVAYPNLASQLRYSGGLHKNEPPEDCFGRFAYQKGIISYGYFGYLWKSGLRFSRNACFPSWASSVR